MAVCTSQAANPSPYFLREKIAQERGCNLAANLRALEIAAADANAAFDSNCRAEVHYLSPLRIHVLRLGHLPTHFIVFREDRREEQGRWSVLGHIEDKEESWRLDVRPERPFLAVTTHPRCGTGCGISHETWYEITETGVSPVLHALNSGHDANAQPARAYHGLPIPNRAVKTPDEIEYIYHLKFRDDKTGADLWHERRLVRFTRRKGARKFEFDPARSELTEDEMRRFYFHDTNVTPDQLFAFAPAPLRAIAKSGTPLQKQWLREYLSKAPNTTWKAELLNALIR